MEASEARHSSKAFSSISLKKTLSSDKTFCRAYRVTAAPCFSFRHLSTMMARTVFTMRSLKRPYLPDATNSCRNCSLRLLISLMRRVETLRRLALLLLLNFFYSEWSFSLEKKEAYY